jgi:predicted HTH transcriptional regulator
MLFRDRVEIWNPGQLPHNLTIAMLKEPHASIPANPLIANPLYLAGLIEQLGTGILDMFDLCNDAGLKEPIFQEEDTFRAIIWRCGEATGQITGQATGQVTGQATGQAERVVLVVNGEMTRSQIQQLIGLAHRETFVDNYINPALRSGLIELKYPDSITHPNQRYMLTEKGLQLKKQLESEIKDNKNS